MSRRRAQGQGSSELMLILSVVTVTVVAASATMVPLFREGVQDLGNDVKAILSNGSVGGVGSGGGVGNGAPSGGNANGGTPGRRSMGTSGDYADALDDYRNTGNASDEIGESRDIGPPPEPS